MFDQSARCSLSSICGFIVFCPATLNEFMCVYLIKLLIDVKSGIFLWFEFQLKKLILFFNKHEKNSGPQQDLDP